ncbi:MAG: 30S ribosomal protein S12 methylthiotransferase RimO [Bacteroidales bacterium]|jgi:ribosomal protein S12 methylthiotransferase|nr:30S ribosomal protein S12 methylthiotransferase RimO [Bacteroidales bacterium]
MIKTEKKINIITLGCSKNLVDSEQLAAKLEENNYKISHNSEIFDFEIAIVNTCGFINDAKEESINTIIELTNAKNNSKLETIIVFGCLSERYMNELKEELPEVDVFFGNYNIDQILEYLNKTNNKQKYTRIFDSPGHYAYLKIAEGCNRNCSFCAIPLFKGKYISRNMEDILDEASYLASIGVKELILIAQDLCYYGYDKNKTFELPELVENLAKIDGIEWIRLHYLYPFLFPERLLDIIAENPKVCKYIDIPLQHISDKVLKSMNRGGTKEQTIQLLNRIRKKIPEAVIRTTMLVGHPEESKYEYDELLGFIKEQRFERLGVFTYSAEEGTRSFYNYKDEITEEVKNERAEKIMEIQQQISYELNSAKIGKIFKVLIDRIEGEFYIGRTEFDSVEVDNDVIIKSENILNIGEFYNVKITGFDDFELYGTVI